MHFGLAFPHLCLTCLLTPLVCRHKSTVWVQFYIITGGCPPGLCRSDRERSTLQVKLKSAQRALTESLNAPHPKSQGQEEGAPKQGGEGNLSALSALAEREVIHKLKSRVYELENEVCVYVCVYACMCACACVV